MIKKIETVEELLELSSSIPLMDVRAPIEFEQGHIPNAINFPILNNEERKEVGISYKQNGHDAAVVLGYKLIGPKFYTYIKEASKLFPQKKIIIHCYRGGLRSKIMANLLFTAGFEVYLLQGGYKKFRHWVLEKLAENYQFNVLGGYTGSGKTGILSEMSKSNFQVIDLEKLANHRGSAFGNIGLPTQPTNEMFENLIGTKLQLFDKKQPIWIEDECSLIGRCKVPKPIYNKMRESTLYFLVVPIEKRIQHILHEYGTFDKDALIKATLKLYKRLGDKRTKEAVNLLEENNLKAWITDMLIYYDKTYLHGMSKRNEEKIIKIELSYFSDLLKKDTL